ncbi:MAG: HPr-rel-A system PqqD family peptide chaperone [Sedimenticola sp.]
MQSTQRVWQISSPGEILQVSWEDEERVIYHTGTGDTHLVNNTSWYLISSLGKMGSADSKELCELIGEYLDISPDGDLLRDLEKLLFELAGIGLIEQTVL